MPSGAKHSFGTTMTVDATAITEITALQGPGIEKDMVDVSHLESTDQWKEFIAGWKNGGTVPFRINFVKAMFVTLMSKFNSSTIQAYVITLPSALGTISFSGYLRKLSPIEERDQQVTADCEVQVSGAVTFA